MDQKFQGKVEVQNAENKSTIELDGGSGDIFAGGNGTYGDLSLKNGTGTEVIRIDSGSELCIVGHYCGAALLLKNPQGNIILSLLGNSIRVGGSGSWGNLRIKSADEKEVLVIDGGGITLGGNGYGGIIRFLSADNKEVTVIDGTGNISLINSLKIGGSGVWGQLAIKDVAGAVTTRIDGGSKVFVGNQGYAGHIFITDAKGVYSIDLDGNSGKVALRDSIHIGGSGVWGQLFIKDVNGTVTSRIDGAGRIFAGCKGYKGEIFLYDTNGQERIHLDGGEGDIKLSGADCAEEFDVAENEEIDPGTVLVIHDDGKLSPSEKPYDKRVAGVASGGEGYHPGIILDRNPNQNKRLPIALTGKTYCRVDAQHAPIELGDLLTTSSLKGHAMKADDPLKSFGTVIGKALSPWKEGKGMIPILVALQ